MTIEGKHTSAVIFTDNIEETALDCVKAQCDHLAFEGVQIVQMPDVHAGNSCNVGTAYRIGAYVNPDHLGVDIGCTISMHLLSAPIRKISHYLTIVFARLFQPALTFVQRTA